MKKKIKPHTSPPSKDSAKDSAKDFAKPAEKLLAEKELIKQEHETAAKEFTALLTDIFIKIGLIIFDYLHIVGVNTQRIIRRITRRTKLFYNKHMSYYFHRLRHWIVRLWRKITKVFRFLIYKVYFFMKFFIDAFFVVKNGYRKKKEKGFVFGIGGAIAAFFKGVYNNRRIFVTWFNYVLPVVSIVSLVYLVQYVSGLDFAVGVEYNGEHIGYIENEAVFEQAETKLQERVTYKENDKVLDNLPKFTLAVVTNQELKSDLQLTDAMIQSSSDDIVKATALMIDGEFYGAVKDADPMLRKLDEMRDKYKTGAEGEVVSFTKDVEPESGLYSTRSIISEEEMNNIITKVEDQDVFYTVVEYDSPSLIAEQNGLTTDELVAMNPDILENCPIGKQVLINKSQPFLPVSVTTQITYEEEIDYKTIYQDSPKKYKGETKVIQKGNEGLQKVTADVVKVDGIEINRKIVGEPIVLQQVTDEVIERGTKQFVSYSFSDDDSPYSGNSSDYGFIWPASGGYISSPFAYRWGRLHTGIDYACHYGTPIRASADGQVIFAGWGNSYGNMVRLSHGGGVQTWYAHASKLNVRNGQMVHQGDVIAYVGSTGQSTGNHVHFEVRVNGSAKNPAKYLP